MTTPTTAHFLIDIEIKEFKCFTDFKASGFKRVNLIGGKNNVGKTAFMEACYINVHSSSVNKMTTAIHSIKYMRENLNILHNLANNKSIDKIQILDATKNYSTKSYLSEIDFYISEKDAIKEYKFSINSELITINAKEFNLIFEYIKNIKVIDNFGWSDNQLAGAYEAIQKHEKENDLSELVQEFDDSIDSFKLIGGTKPQCKTKGEWI
jgi:AAA15 family ATPase/GTPase